jgi:hypothetical protein
MPRDDREQNFDKALARSLSSIDAASGKDCLDAETLAAYHERLLDPEEMALRKAHIAGCERCQEVLAQLEATDRIAVEADRDLMLDQVVLEVPETEQAAAAPGLEPHPTISRPEVELFAAAAPLAAKPLEPVESAPVESAASSDSAAPSQSALPTEAEADPDLESEFIHDPKLLHDPELVPTSAPVPVSAVPRAAAPETIALVAAAKSAPVTQTITFRSPREGRPKMVRFVAIAGALAAGLILWFVYQG